MKKLMFFAVAAIALVACSKTYEVNTKSATSGQIGFGTWASTLTKAEARVQGTNTFLAGDTFAVYGVKTRASGAPTTSTVFNGDVVTASGSPVDDWSYEIPRFWDVNYDSYIFYAISPSAVGTDATVTPASGVISSGSITFAGNDNDILVADKKTVAKGESPYFSDYATVPLVFNHIATLFDLKVKKHTNLNNATVAVTAISLSNMDNVGTFAVSDAYTDSHPVVTWTKTAYTGTYNHQSGVGHESATLPTNVKNDGTDYLIQDLVVMPQNTLRDDSNKQTVTISYTIKVGDEEAVQHNNVSFDLKAFDNSNDDSNTTGSYISSWLPGKHYVYTITIDAKVIDFTVTSITGWGDPITGFHYLMD